MSIQGVAFRIPTTAADAYACVIDGRRFMVMPLGLPNFQNDRYPLTKVLVAVPAGAQEQLKMFLKHKEFNSTAITGGVPKSLRLPIRGTQGFAAQQSAYKVYRAAMDELRGEEGAGKERARVVKDYYSVLNAIPEEEMPFTTVVVLSTFTPQLAAMPNMRTTNEAWTRLSQLKLSSPVEFTGICQLSLATKQGGDSWNYGRKTFESGATGRTFAALYEGTKIHVRILATKGGYDRISTMEQAITDSDGELLVSGDVSMSNVDGHQTLVVLVKTYRKLKVTSAPMVDIGEFEDTDFGISDGDTDDLGNTVKATLDQTDPEAEETAEEAAEGDADASDEDDIPF